jgi:hypothetical protein
MSHCTSFSFCSVNISNEFQVLNACSKVFSPKFVFQMLYRLSCLNNFFFNSDLVIFIVISDESNFYAFVPCRYVKCTRCTEKRTI